MVSCEQVIQEIWIYLDKDMKQEAIVHFEKHLELCRGCFSRVEFEQRLRESMKKKTDACCPSRLKDRIKSLLDKF